MYKYDPKTGEFFQDGKLLATGYSGFGEGKNNPSLEATKMVGPIPDGKYKIGKAYKHAKLGPVTMNLDPIGHNSLGRSAFRIHGDNGKGTASHGCIILPRKVREAIDKGEDKELTVV